MHQVYDSQVSYNLHIIMAFPSLSSVILPGNLFVVWWMVLSLVFNISELIGLAVRNNAVGVTV